MPASEDFEREWSQEELKQHLLTQGFKPEDFVPGEIIPQGVKFTSSERLTGADIAWAKRIISQHPEWGKKRP